MKSIIIASVVAALVSAGAATATTSLVITSAQIKNGTIKLVDISPAARRTLRGTRGTRGLSGPTGPPGAQGNPGGFDPNKLSNVTGASLTIPPNAGSFTTTYCPAGSKAINGGWVVITGGIGEVYLNRATSDGTGWSINVWNHADFTSATVTAYAVCAAP